MDATQTITKEFRNRLIKDMAEQNLADLHLLLIQSTDWRKIQQIEMAIYHIHHQQTRAS